MAIFPFLRTLMGAFMLDINSFSHFLAGLFSREEERTWIKYVTPGGRFCKTSLMWMLKTENADLDTWVF